MNKRDRWSDRHHPTMSSGTAASRLGGGATTSDLSARPVKELPASAPPEVQAALAVQLEASAEACRAFEADPFGIGPVQTKGSAGDGEEQRTHSAAVHGLSGPAERLPFLDAIQASFGRHDISHVHAHVGGAAADASAAIGAEAYASGDGVAFRQAPDLHTAAHEAAHVVQQRAGVSLKGGLGQEGDAYEQHADAVADLVVQGRSAERLLDRHAAGAEGSHGDAVQRKQLPIKGYGAINADDGEFLLFTQSKSLDECKELLAIWIMQTYVLEGFHKAQIKNRLTEADVKNALADKAISNNLLVDYIKDFSIKKAKVDDQALVKEPNDVLKEDFLHRKDLRKFLNPSGSPNVIAIGQANRNDKGETAQVLSDITLSGLKPEEVPQLTKDSGGKYKKAQANNEKLKAQLPKTAERVAITLLGNTDQDGANWGLFKLSDMKTMVQNVLKALHEQSDNDVMLVQLNLLGCQTEHLALGLQKALAIPVVSYVEDGTLLEQTNRVGTNKSSGALAAVPDGKKTPTSYAPHLVRRLVDGTCQTFEEFIEQQRKAWEQNQGPVLDRFFEATSGIDLSEEE